MAQRLICPVFIFCLLFFACHQENKTAEVTGETNVTWSEHIAPIIFKTCTPCHRPGESGPFNLLSYADAVKKAKLIRFVTQTRYMPPWPADPGYSHFVGETVLTAKEIG